MAHLLETMAYVGKTPWHGLGNQLTQKQPIREVIGADDVHIPECKADG